MNWKGFLIGLGIGASPMSGHTQENSQPEPTNSRHTVTLVTDSVPFQKDSTDVLDPISTNVSDSTENKSERSDSIPSAASNKICINLTDSISPEQWGKLTPREKLESCSNLMFLFNIQFETLSAKAYRDSRGTPTIINGLTHIDGEPVKMGTTIKEFQEALQIWDNAINDKNSYLDAMEAYLGPAISEMKPTTEKELLQAQSTLCAWFSFTWHKGASIMGSSTYASALIASQRLARETGNEADIARAASLFNKYAKKFVKDYTKYMTTGDSTALKDFAYAFVNNHNKQKVGNKDVVWASHTRRRESELRVIVKGDCIFGVGERPKCLEGDNSVSYINLLDVYVGGIHSIGKKLPENWADKIQNLNYGQTIGDSLVTQYPELRPGPIPAKNTPTNTAALTAKLKEAFQKSR